MTIWRPDEVVRPEGCDFEYGRRQVPFLQLLQQIAWAAEAGWELVQVIQGAPAGAALETHLLLRRRR